MKKETEELVVDNLKTLFSDASKGFEKWAKDFAVGMNNIVEDLSELAEEQKPKERKAPEEDQIVSCVRFDGDITSLKYDPDAHFFAWQTKQIFTREKEAVAYKRFLLIESQIREIAERIDCEKLKYYLKNISAFKILIHHVDDGEYSQIYIDFAYAIKSEISEEDLKFYFEYER